MRQQLVGISSALENTNNKKFYKKLSPSEKSSQTFKFFDRFLPCLT